MLWHDLKDCKFNSAKDNSAKTKDIGKSSLDEPNKPHSNGKVLAKEQRRLKKPNPTTTLQTLAKVQIKSMERKALMRQIMLTKQTLILLEETAMVCLCWMKDGAPKVKPQEARDVLGLHVTSSLEHITKRANLDSLAVNNQSTLDLPARNSLHSMIIEDHHSNLCNIFARLASYDSQDFHDSDIVQPSVTLEELKSFVVAMQQRLGRPSGVHRKQKHFSTSA
ncbi:hypothetical protein ACH5RR_000901 [Cinchona calisaya]|uniref:Uncharacterized protein n=1 Tax=Cinchona calisaya TaxID=153742 RepID=A0ABD3B1X3_9GENT